MEVFLKSTTIHGMDDALWSLIKDKAQSQNQSINHTIKSILEEHLGIKRVPQAQYFEEFKDFCGAWSKKELAEFNKNASDFQQVNPDDWQ
jgi:hypothetical protein